MGICPVCGGVMNLPTDPSTINSVKLPEEIRRGVNKMTQQLGLTQAEYDKFIRQLEPYNSRQIQRVLDTWTARSYGTAGKGVAYFLGILRNQAAETEIQTKRLGTVPPRV